MRNKYGGQCYRCGKRVAPGEGHFERFGRHHRKKYPNAPRSIKWLTQHAECSVEYRGTNKSIWEK